MRKRYSLVLVFLLVAVLLCIFPNAYAEEHVHTWENRTCTGCGERKEVRQTGDWMYILWEERNEIEITGCQAGDTSAIIPEQISGIPVTAIGERAFSSCTSLTSITIPDGVVSIGDEAFSNCSSLTSITIPDSVTSIGENPFLRSAVRIHVSPKQPAFAVIDGVLFEKSSKRLISFPYGSDVSSYDIPNGILEIGINAFSGCDNLTSVNIPDSVTSIDNYAFLGCRNLISITIPDSVIFIGNSAFSGCRSLSSINIPKGITYISDYAFSRCKNLVSITIPDSIVAIGDYAFQYCENLAIINIPNNVTSIGKEAFSNCISLTSITIPDSVTSIGENPFLRSAVRIHASPKQTAFAVIDGVLFEKATKRLITYPYGSNNECYEIPGDILEIGDYAFSGNDNLTNISIPDGVISIGYSSFSYCSNLTNIIIPDCVVSVEDYAFSNCANLTGITIPDSVSYMGSKVFDGCQNITATVAENSYAEQYCIDNNIHYTFPNALDWLNN